jgi:4-hydroxy-tetrahydrodipicolinate synthase
MSRPFGILTAMITPFDQTGAIDYSVLGPYLAFQQRHGVHGVVVCGTNGEATSLSVTERMQLLENVLAERGKLQVVAGTGAAALPDAVELTRHAGRAGADAVLVLPPFFFKNPTVQGLAAWFREVLDASTIPVYLYNIPHQTSVPISDELLDALSGHPNLAGLKDSTGDWERTGALLKSGRGLHVMPGSDDVLARAMCAGASGSISGTANSLPELVVGVYNAVQNGGDGAAEQERLDIGKKIVLSYPLMAGNKSLLAHRGVPRTWVRPPLVDLTASQEEELVRRIAEIGIPVE